jgi:hypothetical protein
LGVELTTTTTTKNVPLKEERIINKRFVFIILNIENLD